MRFLACVPGLWTIAGIYGNAIAESFEKSYVPEHIHCPPDQPRLRPAAQGLNPEEASWINGRKAVVADSLHTYLERLELQDFDHKKYIDAIKSDDHAHVPLIGFVLSGGGWASAFQGTGALRALDDRLPASKDQKTGGLLQSTSYISGVSGGSWPVMSLAQYDFPAIDDLVKHWQPEISRLGFENDAEYTASADTIFKELGAKAEAGFPVSFADLFGRAVGYQFIPGEKGGIGATFSDVLEKSRFRSHEMPMPMTHLVEIDTDDEVFFGFPLPSTDANIYDVTPFEFGAWQGVKSFFPMKYLGTTMDKGVPVNDTACVVGFDRTSFIIGSSGDALNAWEIESLSNNTLGSFSKRDSSSIQNGHPNKPLQKRSGNPANELEQLFQPFNEYFGLNKTELAPAYYPNPFAGVESVSPPSAQAEVLRLVDGTESMQGLPFWGQIQPARHLDFIIAWDSNADAAPYTWINGTSLYNTYLAAKAASIPFPTIPTATTIINRKYNIRPTLFGCDTDLTTTNSADAPLVLYMANAPYSAYTNYSYIQSEMSNSQFNDVLVNSFNIVTQGNGTIDEEWPACMACASIDRSLAKVGMARTKQCEKCMAKYCWDGTGDDVPAGVVDPSLVLDPEVGFAEWRKTHDFQEGKGS